MMCFLPFLYLLLIASGSQYFWKTWWWFERMAYTRKLDHSEQLNILSAATNCIMLYDTTDCLHDMRLCYFPAVSPAPEHAPAAWQSSAACTGCMADMSGVVCMSRGRVTPRQRGGRGPLPQYWSLHFWCNCSSQWMHTATPSVWWVGRCKQVKALFIWEP